MAREVWCNETAAFDEGGALSVISVISIVQSNLQRTLIDLTISRHHCNQIQKKNHGDSTNAFLSTYQMCTL